MDVLSCSDRITQLRIQLNNIRNNNDMSFDDKIRTMMPLQRELMQLVKN
jgi:hypothetical protein